MEIPDLYRDGVLLPASPIQFSGIDDPALPVQRALDKERVFPRRDMVALMVRPVPLVGQKAVLRCGPRYGIYLYGWAWLEASPYPPKREVPLSGTHIRLSP